MSLAVYHVPFILLPFTAQFPPPIPYSLHHDHLPNHIINNAIDLNCSHSIFSRSLHCVLPHPPLLNFPSHVVSSTSASVPHLSSSTRSYLRLQLSIEAIISTLKDNSSSQLHFTDFTEAQYEVRKGLAFL